MNQGIERAVAVISDLGPAQSSHSSPLTSIAQNSFSSYSPNVTSTKSDQIAIRLHTSLQSSAPSRDDSQTNQIYKSGGHGVAVSLGAGAMAGAIAKTVIAPFDRTKINFQATNMRYSNKQALIFARRCYENEGFFSLWRGNSATMARIVPYAAIQFTAHEQFKKVLKLDGSSKHPSYWRFIAGSLAGVTSQFLTYPLDLARARMAVTQRDTYRTLSQVFVKISQKDGFLTLYRGLTPTMLGVIPYAGTSFGIYESLKAYRTGPNLSSQGSSTTPNPLERVTFGAMAGLVGQTSAYPLDIVRRRMQTASLTGNSDAYNTIQGTLLKVYREEGIVHGLYKGLSLNWIKGPISVGISFAVFDYIKHSLERLS